MSRKDVFFTMLALFLALAALIYMAAGITLLKRKTEPVTIKLLKSLSEDDQTSFMKSA